MIPTEDSEGRREPDEVAGVVGMLGDVAAVIGRPSPTASYKREPPPGLSAGSAHRNSEPFSLWTRRTSDGERRGEPEEVAGVVGMLGDVAAVIGRPSPTASYKREAPPGPSGPTPRNGQPAPGSNDTMGFWTRRRLAIFRQVKETIPAL